MGLVSRVWQRWSGHGGHPRLHCRVRLPRQPHAVEEVLREISIGRNLRNLPARLAVFLPGFFENLEASIVDHQRRLVAMPPKPN